MRDYSRDLGLEQRGHSKPLHERLRPETLREKAANRRRALLNTALAEGSPIDGSGPGEGIGRCVYHRTVTIDGHCTDCARLVAGGY